jgi:predicted nucleic-acid-binding protein
MKITVDTSILLRAVLHDDPVQSREAEKILGSATLVAVPAPCLCEFVWALSHAYGIERAEIAHTVETLCNAPTVVVNRIAVNAGLAVFKAGGDFTDGVIAYEGSWLGGETFVSFDNDAVAALTK